MRNQIKKILNKLTLHLQRKKDVEIGINTKISADALLQPGIANRNNGSIVIHNNCELSRGVIIKAYGGSVTINQNTFLGEYVVIYGHGGVEIGQNTLIAMHTCIVSANHTIPDKDTLIRSQPDILLPVKIGDDVWIGAGVKILGGVTIGDGCVVGAGTVVTQSLPPYAKAVGVPAKIVGYRS